MANESSGLAALALACEQAEGAEEKDAAVTKFCGLCGPIARTYIRNKGPKTEAEDIAQDVCRVVCVGIRAGELREPNRAYFWVLRIIKNERANFYRKQRRRLPEISTDSDGVGKPLAELIIDPARRPEEAAISSDIWRRVQAAMSVLTDKERRSLQFQMEGETAKDIADFLLIAPETVRSHWSHARAKLRRELGKHFPGLRQLDRELSGDVVKRNGRPRRRDAA